MLRLDRDPYLSDVIAAIEQDKRFLFVFEPARTPAGLLSLYPMTKGTNVEIVKGIDYNKPALRTDLVLFAPGFSTVLATDALVHLLGRPFHTNNAEQWGWTGPELSYKTKSLQTTAYAGAEVLPHVLDISIVTRLITGSYAGPEIGRFKDEIFSPASLSKEYPEMPYVEAMKVS